MTPGLVEMLTARIEARYRLRIVIQPTPPAFDAPFRGVPHQNTAMPYGMVKLELLG